MMTLEAESALFLPSAFFMMRSSRPSRYVFIEM
jgi:hypothetical protein